MINRLSFLAVGTLLTVSFLTITAFASGAATAPGSPTEMLASHTSSLHPIALPGVAINNFGVVDGHIYRGEQPSGKDYAALVAIGVKTIIDLRGDAKGSARHDAEAAGLRYINIPIDGHGTPTDAQANEFMKDVDDPANGIVYVHCAGGRHRTGSMIAVYRMVRDGWNIDQAYNEMLAYDFYTGGGHEGFKTYVYDFYHRMPTAPSTSTATAANPAPAGQTAAVKSVSLQQ